MGQETGRTTRGPGLFWGPERRYLGMAAASLGRVEPGDAGPVAMVERHRRGSREQWWAFVLGARVPGSWDSFEEACLAAEAALCQEPAPSQDGGENVRCLLQPGHKPMPHRGRRVVTPAAGTRAAVTTIVTWPVSEN